MTFREQVLFSVLTLLLIPLILKGFDSLFKAAAARFGTPRRRSYAELEQEIWRFRDTLRRVNDGVIQLEEWDKTGNTVAVSFGIANLRAEIDPALLNPFPVPASTSNPP